MADFETRLSAMVSKELTGDAAQIGGLVEQLTRSLGFAIAIASRGDAAMADTLLEGASGYLAEEVARHEKLARLMASFRQTRP